MIAPARLVDAPDAFSIAVGELPQYLRQEVGGEGIP